MKNTHKTAQETAVYSSIPMMAEEASTTLFSRSVIRSICVSLVILCSFVWYTPSVYAAVNEWGKEPIYGLESHSPMAATMRDIRDQLRALEVSPQSSFIERFKQHRALKSDIKQLKEQDQQYRLERQNQLSNAENLAKEQTLSTEIIQRISQSISSYNAQSDQLIQSLEQLVQDDWEAGADSSTFAEALSLLSPFIERPYQSYGSDLDFIEPSPRSMFDTQTEIESLVGQSGELTLEDIEYLETDNATQTSTLVADLAAQLNYDPVTIYNWVHDNIRWLPQYGLMQSADYTLQAEQGNAFDVSSLLIALLRESSYPSRYVYGSVGVELDDIRNWVGDVINTDAAINLVSQGGIPQQLLTYGGSEAELQLEHVWAQVKINDQWIDLDASFKDIEYSEGLNLQEQVVFDAEGLIEDLQASATSNDTEGWVQGIDTTEIQTRLEAYQTELETYIDTNAPDATLGDVLGQSTIIPSTALTIEDTQTRFTQVLARQPIQQLPDSLKYQFQLQIGSAVGGTFGTPVEWAGELAELSEYTAALLGQSIAISFTPATEADETLLESYLPDVITGVEDLPDSLPAGDVNMIGEITLDGEVIATTSPQPLGTTLMTRLGFIGPASSASSSADWRYTENNLVVGQYQAVGIDMQGLSPGQLEALQAKLETTQASLEAEDYTDLTKHDVTGDLLQAGIQGYMATTYAMDKIAAQAADIVYLRRPSYGTFSTQLEVAYFFGTPQRINFSGLIMDVDRVSMNTEHRENCYEDWVAFNRSSGMRNSALEHEIPEQLFSTEENPAEGVSTAKALAIAAAEGQKIYTLTEDNAGQLSNITIDDGARAQIQEALNAGMEVTVHESPINVNGWEGSGYAVLDPDYGVGAYLISGGSSGGWLLIAAGVLMIVLSLITSVNPVAAAVIFSAGLLLISCGISSLTSDARYFNYASYAVGSFLLWVASFFSSGGSIFAGAIVTFELSLIQTNAGGACADF